MTPNDPYVTPNDPHGVILCVMQGFALVALVALLLLVLA
jgi:hypothetical protein